MATVRGTDDFDADSAAEVLREAMKGFGTDEKAIVDILAQHNNEQRLEIRSVFKTKYGKDLIDDLKSELGGNFEDVVIAMMDPPRVFDAKELHHAIAGAGTTEDTLIEVICSRSNDEIEEIKAAYKKEYDNDLESDISGDTSGYFRRLMVSLLNGGRDDTPDIDDDTATEEAQKIFDAGEAQLGTDESEFNSVLCRRSFPQLRVIFEKYQEIAGKDIQEAIESETSGSLQDGYVAIVKLAKNSSDAFAERLYYSMKGLGTDDRTLIRVIVSRSEVDLETVKDCFKARYDTTLASFIEDDCGGDYKRMLLAIVGY